MITRKNHGTGHSYRVNGRKYPGVTTILHQMPKPGLIGWAGRTTAEHAVNNWERLGGLPPTDRLAELVAAPNAERDAAARRGTQVHRLAESLAIGRAVEVPEPLAGHVDSYRKFLADHEPEPVAVELVVANRRVRYCGTSDLVAQMGGWTWLLELKTSRSGIFRESALQACAYSRAETYAIIGEDGGAEHPLSELGIERAGAVHIRADGYDLYPLDIGDDVWRYFTRLAWMHHRDDETREWVGEAVEPDAFRAGE